MRSDHMQLWINCFEIEGGNWHVNRIIVKFHIEKTEHRWFLGEDTHFIRLFRTATKWILSGLHFTSRPSTLYKDAQIQQHTSSTLLPRIYVAVKSMWSLKSMWPIPATLSDAKLFFWKSNATNLQSIKIAEQTKVQLSISIYLLSQKITAIF